ncbi:MAG TPA: GntR family transcriptional regulator [Solirubrobacteraceae bacterium]|jgi:DNA-binding transcriptional regulator YhcF (GntR family)|nr:GntR family transcriptional regulator [Solirubrobacteraceae bacterium]
MQKGWLEDLGVSLDRQAEVPVGLQLTWAVRSAIRSGQLAPGQRLPSARELAEAVGVNVNTLRTVIARLELEGYLDTRHGTGTFVTANPPRRTNMSGLVDDVARAARHAGIDPRDLAGALYTADIPPAREGSDMGKRRELRQQIAVLDRLHAELALRAGAGLPTLGAHPTKPIAQPRLLSIDELAAQRDALLDAIGRLREKPTEDPPPPPPPTQRKAPRPTRRPAAPRPRIQPA